MWLSIVVLTLISLFIASADTRETLPKVLPIGTDVRAIVISQSAGQTDIFNKDINHFTMFIEFQDINSTLSETHYVDVQARTSSPKDMHNDIINSIRIKASILKYDLKEVYLIDYIKEEIK